MFSCNQEESLSSSSDQKLVSTEISERSNPDKDLIWLQNFQQHLQNLQSGNPTSTTYNQEDALFGLEWLFNYALGENVLGITTDGESTLFDLPSDGNWFTLYNQVENQVYSEINEKSNLDFSFMSLEVIEGENKLELTTKFKYTSPEIVDYFSGNNNGAFSCENPPFIDQEFYLGLGGENGEEPFFPSGCEFNECNVELPCEQPNYPTALEMVEAFHNADIKNKFICKGDNEMISFSNITQYFISQSQLSLLIDECSQPIEDSFIDACDCASTDALNCMYCITSDFIDNHLETINVTPPEGLELIEIDLFVDYINPLGTTFYTGWLIYGQVDCIPSIIRDEPPISIEIVCC